LIDSILQGEGLELSQIKLKHFRKPFFSRGNRAIFLIPSATEGKGEPDETHPGRYKLLLAFELPRGGYATMVIKRLTAVSAVR
jgi:tRNA pseudouridine13 synthase